MSRHLSDATDPLLTSLAGYEMLQLKYDKMDVVEEADHRVRLDFKMDGDSWESFLLTSKNKFFGE